MADVVHNTGEYYADTRKSDTRSDVTVLGAILKRTTWGAVIAGAVVAISCQMLLTVLGITLLAEVADGAGSPLWPTERLSGQARCAAFRIADVHSVA